MYITIILCITEYICEIDDEIYDIVAHILNFITEKIGLKPNTYDIDIPEAIQDGDILYIKNFKCCSNTEDAIRNGHEDCIEKFGEVTISQVYMAIYKCETGTLDKVLSKIGKGEADSGYWFQNFIRESLKLRHLEITKVIYNRMTKVHHNYASGLTYMVLASGYFEAAKWFRSLDPPEPWGYETERINFPPVRELMEWGRGLENKLDPLDWKSSILRGSFEDLKWARDPTKQQGRCPWGYIRCHHYYDDPEALEWVRGEENAGDLCPWGDILNVAVDKKDYSMIKNLLDPNTLSGVCTPSYDNWQSLLRGTDSDMKNFIETLRNS